MGHAHSFPLASDADSLQSIEQELLLAPYLSDVLSGFRGGNITPKINDSSAQRCQ